MANRGLFACGVPGWQLSIRPALTATAAAAATAAAFFLPLGLGLGCRNFKCSRDRRDGGIGRLGLR